ncbi:TPA: hypothetical protein U0515_001883 [Streptococcus suis]|uniref:hypothetical protein n=1 Tax=Streptococcus suis TaxID=1307 RepID=UPI0004105206|nr:hypothetical protein [Streptococcus suis]MCK3953537.1 hypothetical protein [Streptococcus suis]MCK4058023.1 hypothetical protein [Streptococcus suis]HEL1686648.1 hypothetical protein [Streptococcus suis]HEM2662669.1 hypothetical protein [Streptococcus suis]HEM3226042.1 hypothetical protein [Streptococcus suis 8074]
MIKLIEEIAGYIAVQTKTIKQADDFLEKIHELVLDKLSCFFFSHKVVPPFLTCYFCSNN